MTQVLLYLKNHTTIKWTDRGKVFINDNIVSNSHIIDLVRDLLVPNGKKKPPQGALEFSKFLNTIHIPDSLISKEKRERYLQSLPKKEEEEDDDEEDDEDEKSGKKEPVENLIHQRKTKEEKITSDFYVERDIRKLFKPKMKKRKWIRIDSFF